MAELPELWSDRLPDRPPPPGMLFDRAHSYGVAHDLERMRAGLGPEPRARRVRTRGVRRRSGPLAVLRRWWATTDNGPADVWHRIRCGTGHHDFRGGHQVQLGSRFVLVERRCAWCDCEPSL
ncbi:MAG TPA: hypothetical protein VGV86_07050 [Acidimicrobiales bacterium]|nr:hypothetical protein [Acidimicrobiales bacterium]